MGSIKSIINSLLGYVYDEVNIASMDDILAVESISFEDDTLVYLNKKNQRELYAIELSSSGTNTKYLDSRVIDDMFKNFKQQSNAYYIIAYLKKGYYQKTYIFANEKEILQLISKNLQVNFLNNLELTNVIFDLLCDQNYFINTVKKKIERDIEAVAKVQFESLYSSYYRLASDSVYKLLSNKKRSIDIYQAYRHGNVQKRSDITSLYRLKWEGVIFQYVDFSNREVSRKINNLKTQALYEGKNKKEFDMLFEKHEADLIDLAVVNTVGIFKDIDTTTVSLIEKCLNLDLQKREIFARKIVKYLPLKKRDTTCDLLVEKQTTLYDTIGVVHKAVTKDADFIGFDVNGAFVDIGFNYNTANEPNKNSMYLILGVAGSGKTTFTNGFIGQMIGVDFDKLNRLSKEELKAYDQKELIRDLDTQYIRDFDIKHSGKKLAELIKKVDSKDTQFIDASLNNFSYNPFNLSYQTDMNGQKVIDENELSMNILLLGITLECRSKSSEKNGFDIGEESILKEAVRKLFNMNFKSIHVKSIETTHREVYNELIASGYCNLDSLDDIKDVRYNFLKVPTLKHIMKEVELQTQYTSDEQRTRDAKSLYSKIKNIDSMKIFSSYDNADIKLSKYLYIDFEEIKLVPEFIPIFLAMFNRMYNEDKKSQRRLQAAGKPRPQITYKFEEAFNLFSQPSFELYLQKFINEARSEKIRGGFITQTVAQVPEYVYRQVANKFFLFPQGNAKNQLIESITEVMKPREETIELMHKTPEFGVLLWNEHGNSVFKLNLSQDEIDVYGQDAN